MYASGGPILRLFCIGTQEYASMALERSNDEELGLLQRYCRTANHYSTQSGFVDTQTPNKYTPLLQSLAVLR